MRNKNIVKKQHYNPVVYLKRFTNENTLLEVLDLENKRILTPKHPSQVCYGKFFYGENTGIKDHVSQVVEDYLKSVEDNIKDFLDSFEKIILDAKQINDNYIYEMAYLISYMWVRNAAFREQISRTIENLIKQIYKIRVSDEKNLKKELNKSGLLYSDEKIKKLRHLIQDANYQITTNNEPHLKLFREIDYLARFFFNKNWRVYIADKNFRFITSDNPVIEIFPPKTHIYSYHINLRKQYFPISPKVLIELNPPQFGKHLIRKTIGDDKVKEFNLERADHSLNYCYAKEKKELQQMLIINKAHQDLLLKRVIE